MAIGFNVPAVGDIIPDRFMLATNTPKVLLASFGDGYEQRLLDGINASTDTFNLTFNNRPKAEIDDIVAFFVSKQAVTSFDFTYWDTNGGGGETTVKVVASTWSIIYNNDIAYSLQATFRRVYE